MKGLVFAKRVGKEILRDPLSYIFCLGFPIVMLIVMSVVDGSIPPGAGMTVFHMENLAPGMAYFGLTFIMLFTATQVSKDRTTALLLRLYASPMKSADYVAGYTVPMCLLGVVQMFICFAAAEIIALVRGTCLPVASVLLSMLLMLPSLLLFTGAGILFGCAFSDKAAPGLCSILISSAGMLGGIWMDVEGLGGALKTVAEILPFYHGVKAARMPFAPSTGGIFGHLLYTLVFSLLFYCLAVLLFTAKMKKDVR